MGTTTTLPTDLEIGRATDLLPIEEVAAWAGIAAEHLEPYGRYIAKVSSSAEAALSDQAPAKYVVITAVTPTPLGEGKTTTAIGLAQGLSSLGTARCSPYGSHRSGRPSASRAAPLAPATARSCRWRPSTCI